MESTSAVDLGRVAQDLQLKKVQVFAVVELLDSGNTVPFITRYRKEQTGGLDEEQIRAIQHRVGQLRQLVERRQIILRTIESQGKLTDDLRAAIERAETLKRLEDLYLPYKPKKQTLATIARERGLGPLAEAVWTGDETVRDLDQLLPGIVDPEKQLHTVEDVLNGIGHILAEMIAETAEVRQAAREVLWEGRLQSIRHSASPNPMASESEPEDPEQETKAGSWEGDAARIDLDEFRNYFRYEEPLRHVPPHRLLAINRGERRGVLKVRLDFDYDRLIWAVMQCLPLENHPHQKLLENCALDAIDRLLVRSLEREARGEITEWAERHAVEVFARNLRNLLLQPPVNNKRVLAIDPGYRTGCKWAVLDEIGNLLDHGTVFPHVKRKKKKKQHKPEPIAGSAPPANPRASALPDNKDESPAVLPADSVHRATEPEGAEDHGLEAEIDREWKQLSQGEFQANPASPVHKKRRARRRDGRRPRRMNPAHFGVVIPPPGLFDEEILAPPPEAQPEPEESSENVSRRQRSKTTLAELCKRYEVSVLAIGNGTACRETEELVAEIIAEGLSDVPYVIVNEAGASVYSTSAVGREEFPQHDATLRSTISIGRRLQDPLSELVKIDPQNIGVGLYQHDINPRILRDSLSEVVESCVNYVGVDVNTASVPLLRYVSGLNQLRAKNLVEYRRQNGPFKNREDIQKVPGVGPETYTQAAGFLKIRGGDQPLDATWIHPESYATAQRILELLGYEANSLADKDQFSALHSKLAETNPAPLAQELGAGEPTILDILENLGRPGRDPREDLPKPIFKTGVLRLEDLTPGMELKGTVLNVVDFGVFVDIGLKDSGLVHISEVADRFIRSPHDVVSVGDVVTTWVLQVDAPRRRVSLTMINPAHPRPPRPPRRERGRRRQPPPQQQQQPEPQGPPTEQLHEAQDRRGRPPQQQGRPPAQRRQQQPQREGRREQAAREYGRHQRRGSNRGEAPAKPRPVAETKREKPQVKLTEEKLTGKSDLNSFGELKALFELRNREPQQPKPRSSEEPKEGDAPPAQPQ